MVTFIQRPRLSSLARRPGRGVPQARRGRSVIWHYQGDYGARGYRDGTAPQPSLPSLSYAKGVTPVNAAIVAVGSDGAIDVYNAGSSPVRIAVDLTGSYYACPG